MSLLVLLLVHWNLKTSSEIGEFSETIRDCSLLEQKTGVAIFVSFTLILKINLTCGLRFSNKKNFELKVRIWHSSSSN